MDTGIAASYAYPFVGHASNRTDYTSSRRKQPEILKRFIDEVFRSHFHDPNWTWKLRSVCARGSSCTEVYLPDIRLICDFLRRDILHQGWEHRLYYSLEANLPTPIRTYSCCTGPASHPRARIPILHSQFLRLMRPCSNKDDYDAEASEMEVLPIDRDYL